ncbi:universal stress protein [Thalassotalea profundi]|uniref:Universal stress protein n=1 Tax=Thalassotalea profundi TaxID=2036687 RepID=A0ABQ3IIH0_9GAMM|nr:universal stress protein [Thalassotalea profundi]GHE82528.1 hypothetical protein GCM10011501_08460 [Thalassotalea profundi]
MAKQLYVVGVDGSEWSKRAVERAIKLAEKTGADVSLVYISEDFNSNPLATRGVFQDGINHQKEEKNIIKNILEPIIKSTSLPSVNTHSVVLWGEPVEKLHQYVKAQKATMIFVGRRGRSRVVDLILGSVANKLAHYSSVPIVLVP